MIHIARLPEPDILRDKKQAWTESLLEKRKNAPKAQPRSDQYAHAEIKDTLWRMSHHKCFYCEQSVKEANSNVDHYIEHALRPELAFEWGNLYGSCQDCNSKKKDHTHIPVDICVDPCDPAIDPADHLNFSVEMIGGLSEKGLNTIKKYSLDREDLDRKRAKKLLEFEQRLRKIREKDGPGSQREKDLLRAFAQATQPFSLMFVKYLQTENLSRA